MTVKEEGACAVRHDHTDLHQTSHAKTDHAKCFMEDKAVIRDCLHHE